MRQTEGGRGGILVVDDEKGLRDMLTYSLSRRGWSVDAAEGGEAAVELARRRSYRVAICDIMMPGMDGVETLKALRQAQPGLEVVMVTGYATLETAVRTMKLGAFDYIAKPYDLEELCTVLDRADEHRRLVLRLAELEELDHLKSHLLVGLGHELQRPLADILRETGRPPEEGAAALERIRRGAARMLDSVEGILHYWRLDAGNIPAFMEEFDLGEVLGQVAEALMPRALEKPVELTWKAPSPLPLKSDRLLVKQVLLNLVDGALHDSRGGSVSLSADPRDGGAVLRLHATGLRLSPEEVPLLFSPRPRTEGGWAPPLGLPLTKRIIERLGGTLSIEGGAAAGAQVVVALPAAGKGA